MNRPAKAMLPGLTLALLLFLGCPGPPSSNETRGSAEGATWPRQVEGTLLISVELGDVGPDSLSKANFGTISTSTGDLLIAVDGDVLRRSGLTRSQLFGTVRVRVTLLAPRPDDRSPPTFVISELSRLEPLRE